MVAHVIPVHISDLFRNISFSFAVLVRVPAEPYLPVMVLGDHVVVSDVITTQVMT